MKNVEIRQISIVLGCGSGQGDYKIGLGQKQEFDIDDSFNAPDTWTRKVAWYQVTDAIQDYPKWRGINVYVKGKDITLFLDATNSTDAQIRLTVFALYETP